MSTEWDVARKMMRTACPPTCETVWQEAKFPGKRTPNTFEAGQRIRLTKPGYDLSDDVVTIQEIHYYDCDGRPEYATKFYVFATDKGGKGTMPERYFPTADWQLAEEQP